MEERKNSRKALLKIQNKEQEERTRKQANYLSALAIYYYNIDAERYAHIYNVLHKLKGKY